MQLKPLYDRVIVKPIAKPETSAGGIALTATERPDRAEVLAVGPGLRTPAGTFLPMDVKVGDTVVLGKYAGTMVKVGGEEFLVLKEEDIFAVEEA